MQKLTFVLGVVQRAAEDLEGPSYVQGVVARVQAEQHLDDLNRTIGGISDCTHRV